MAKKEEYRLKTLLEIREQKKEEAERYLAQCMQALKVEQDRLKEMKLELERMIARREAKKREYAEKQMRGEMSAQASISANVFIDRLKEQEEAQENAIEHQRGIVQQKQDDVDGAREDLVKANQEVKALDKHKEKWEEKIKRERMLKEENEMDDIAQTMFGRDRYS